MNAVVLGVLVALVAATLLVLAVAARRRNGAATVNAAASLAVAVVAIAVATGFRFDGGFIVPELAVWAAVAGLLHSVGMLGPYDSLWWWDHLTHTVSATLLTALVYAAFIVAVGEAWSYALVAAAAVGFTVLAGVFWELVELAARAVGDYFGIDPVLVHYGWRDTAYDLLFDFVGAVAVVALDVRAFVPITAEAPQVTRQALTWTTGLVVLGSALLSVLLVRRVGQPS